MDTVEKVEGIKKSESKFSDFLIFMGYAFLQQPSNFS